MPGSLERAPCARVVITQRPHGPVMFRRTAAPVAAVHAASSEAYGVRLPSEGRVGEGEVGITELEERVRIRPGRVEGAIQELSVQELPVGLIEGLLRVDGEHQESLLADWRDALRDRAKAAIPQRGSITEDCERLGVVLQKADGHQLCVDTGDIGGAREDGEQPRLGIASVFPDQIGTNLVDGPDPLEGKPEWRGGARGAGGAVQRAPPWRATGDLPERGRG